MRSTKAFGGQYWADDEVDHRDYTRGADSNAEMIRAILSDLLARLKKFKWLATERATLSLEELLRLAEDELSPPVPTIADDPPSLRERAYLFGLLEFIRAVHAEMAAVISAARRGAKVDECVMYATTFPCHECARHIVAAGIKRLVFIEPYPKSRVPELYDDSITLEADATKVPFEAYVGLSPRRYMDFFAAPKRREGKSLVDWDRVRTGQTPRHARSAVSYLDAEVEYVDLFNQSVKVAKAKSREVK